MVALLQIWRDGWFGKAILALLLTMVASVVTLAYLFLSLE